LSRSLREKAERLPVRQLDRLVDWRERGWGLAVLSANGRSLVSSGDF
jgi:hypothetical protein